MTELARTKWPVAAAEHACSSAAGDVAPHDPQECNARLQFEKMLADLSARFVNLPAEEVDVVIEEAQRRVCECLALDVCVLWQWEVDAPGVFTLTHHYRRVDGPPLTRQLNAAELWPWCLREILARRTIVLSSTEEIREGTERDMESFRYFGVKTVLAIPLFAGGGAPFGLLSFHDQVRSRTWSESERKRLELIAQVFANAIVRKRTEQTLRESEERLALAAEAAGAGTWVLDATGTYFMTSPETMAVIGMPPGERITVEDFLALVHPDDQQLLQDKIKEGLQSREIKIAEYRIVRPNGEVRWMVSRGRMCSRAGFGQMRFAGITTDVTEQRQSDDFLRQLFLATENSPVSVVITDSRGVIVYVNQKFVEVSGYSKAECIGQNPRILKSGETSPSAYKELWDRVTNGVTWRGEFHNRKKNGELYWESAIIMPIIDAHGRITHLVGIKEDITKQKHLEHELDRQRNELTHLSRVTTMGELSNSLAHELNQPLAIILTNAQAALRLLAQQPPDIAEALEILADIISEDQRAGDVIRRLRSHLKAGAVETKVLAMNDLVRDVLLIARNDLIGRGVTIHTALADRLPLTTGDHIQLQQVILNLILNAAEAMATNPPSQRHLSIQTMGHDGAIRVSISDNGGGLPPDVESIFAPFYTTKKEGLGLGLTICRSIASAHKGRLWAEAKGSMDGQVDSPYGGHGATFHFELPVAEEGQGRRSD